MYVIVMPFIVLHWIVNDNTCALTIIENGIRTQIYGKCPDKNESFTGSLIEPIYDFKKNHENLSTLIYTITFILWFISFYKLYSKYKEGTITSITDLLQT